jgi:hypothetical protein
MSTYLRLPGGVLIIEFPLNTIEQVRDAVSSWIHEGAVTNWNLEQDGVHLVLVTNFKALTQVVISNTPPADDEMDRPIGPPPVVQAVLEPSDDAWDVRRLGDA